MHSGSPRPRHGSSVIDRRTTTGLDIGHDHARALAAVPAGRYGSLCVTDRRTALEPAAVGQRAPRERALEGSRVGPHARPGRRAIAADLARLGLPAARLVTSDLVRAVETAQIVGERIGLVPELDARLREQHLGELEGRSYENSWARAKLHDWSDPELPLAGGESVGQVRRRLAAVLADLAPGTPTVLISHGDAIRCALAHLLGQSITETPWVEVKTVPSRGMAVARLGGSRNWG
jgi:broad specificity phosphatase PhoE